MTHRSLTWHDTILGVNSSSSSHLQQERAGSIANRKLRRYAFSCSDAADMPAWILVYGKGIPTHSQIPPFSHHVAWFYHPRIPIEQHKRGSITLPTRHKYTLCMKHSRRPSLTCTLHPSFHGPDLCKPSNGSDDEPGT